MKTIIFSLNPNNLEQTLKNSKVLVENSSEIIGITTKESKFKGFDKIYVLNNNLNNDSHALLLKEIFEKEQANVVTALHNRNHVDILAQFSALKRLLMFTKVTNIALDKDNFIIEREVLGGSATCSVRINKTRSFSMTLENKRVEWEIADKSPILLNYEFAAQSIIKVKEIKEKQKDENNLENAEIVIGVGRGFKSKEDLKLAYELAEILKGAVASTRPIAADFKWMSEDSWVGVSSKSIKPKLYIAIGISGAPQHIAGIKDSKTIIAINIDKNAPIANYSDYFVIADLYKLLPILISKLKSIKN
jgi:electron transfer flavoprotein alpha subunit